MNVTKDVLHAVRRDLYSEDRFAWAEEVRLPGLGGSRRVDAVCVDTREPCLVTGLEVKVSRGDWLAEVRGGKYVDGFMACDAWVFVFGSPTVYRLDEVPRGCGVVHVVDGCAVVVRECVRVEVGGSLDRELVRLFLVRLLRGGDAFGRRALRDAEARGFRRGLRVAGRGGASDVGVSPGPEFYCP